MNMIAIDASINTRVRVRSTGVPGKIIYNNCRAGIEFVLVEWDIDGTFTTVNINDLVIENNDDRTL